MPTEDRSQVEFIDTNGKSKFTVRWVRSSSNFSEGVARLSLLDNTAIAVDHCGHKVMHVAECTDIGEFHNRKCYAATNIGSYSLYGYLNMLGKWSIPPQFYGLRFYRESRGSVRS